MGSGVNARREEQRGLVRAFLSDFCTEKDWANDPYRALRRLFRLGMRVPAILREKLGVLADAEENILDATVTDVYLGA